MSNSLQLRMFDEQFITAFRRDLVAVLRVPGEVNLPQIFRLPVAVALADTIVAELFNMRVPPSDSDSGERIEALIERYRRTIQYHYAMMNGEAKYNAQMEKVADITESERLAWQRRFAHLKQQQRAGNRKVPMTTIQRRFSRV